MSTPIIPKEIHPGVHLLREIRSPTEQILSIQNRLKNILDFTVNFEGSRGITLKETALLSRKITVNPKEIKLLATVYMKGKWELKQAFRIEMKPPPEEISERIIRKNTSNLQSKIQAARQLISTTSIDHLTLRQVTDNLGNLIDPLFTPSPESISRGAEAVKFRTNVMWRRPSEFMNGPFNVFLDEIEPNDIKQGMLGDCWLMCALASLAEQPDLVRRLFVTKTSNTAGMYRVRLWKDGEPITITVDDYFPCFPQGLPVFSRSHGNELWVLLLEKVFAKINGSYMLLRGGWAFEGMSDLTGCPTENLDFEDDEVQLMLKRDQIWPLLQQADEEGSLMSASTHGEDMWTEAAKPDREGGLVPGHAYTIISVREAHGFRLLNIRNPWGTFEWDGNWSDRSPLWTLKMRKAINPVLDSSDGTFWMNYEDFTHNFTGINICWVKDFEEARMKGLFVKEHIGSIERVVPNKYYAVRPRHNVTVYLGVHQPDERMYGVADKCSNLDIGIVVLKVLSNGSFEIVDQRASATERQSELIVDLNANTNYIIVPRTTGCALQRPSTARRENLSLIDRQGELHALFIVTLIDLFKKFNIAMDSYLSDLQFQKMFEDIGVVLSNRDVTKIFQSYPSNRQGLALDGFLKYMQDKTETLGEPAIWRWLEGWGYDHDLYSVKSRRFVFTIHSLEKVHVIMKNQVGSGVSNLVDQLLLQHYGVKKSAIRAAQLYCLYEPKANSFIYGIYNSGSTPVDVEFDASKSEGIAYGIGSTMTRCRVKGDAWEILNYFQILKNCETCTINPQLTVSR